MTILRQLNEPLFEKITNEYRELLRDLEGHLEPEANELRGFVQRKLRQLEMVQVSLSYLGQESAPDQMDLRETLRQLKLELRFARRRWKRHLTSTERLQRLERKPHVPTFAA